MENGKIKEEKFFFLFHLSRLLLAAQKLKVLLCFYAIRVNNIEKYALNTRWAINFPTLILRLSSFGLRICGKFERTKVHVFTNLIAAFYNVRFSLMKKNGKCLGNLSRKLESWKVEAERARRRRSAAERERGKKLTSPRARIFFHNFVLLQATVNIGNFSRNFMKISTSCELRCLKLSIIQKFHVYWSSKRLLFRLVSTHVKFQKKTIPFVDL